MKFSDIIGQQALKRRLAESVDRGRISHAQLFTGAAGTGALPLAIAYAQYISCTSRRDGDSCGECPSCRQIEALAHPDVHFVFPVNKQGKKSGETVLSGDFMPLWRETAARTGGYFSPREWADRLDLGRTLRGMISAREADEIIRKLSFKSFESQYKIMIVWQPETMNDEAASEIEVLRAESAGTVLKVILETGALKTPELIRKASLLSMFAGADFIKTSTGKIDVAATPEAAVVMCHAIRDYHERTGRRVGFKAAGGVRSAEDAALYYTQDIRQHRLQPSYATSTSSVPTKSKPCRSSNGSTHSPPHPANAADHSHDQPDAQLPQKQPPQLITPEITTQTAQAETSTTLSIHTAIAIK